MSGSGKAIKKIWNNLEFGFPMWGGKLPKKHKTAIVTLGLQSVCLA